MHTQMLACMNMLASNEECLAIIVWLWPPTSSLHVLIENSLIQQFVLPFSYSAPSRTIALFFLIWPPLTVHVYTFLKFLKIHIAFKLFLFRFLLNSPVLVLFDQYLWKMIECIFYSFIQKFDSVTRYRIKDGGLSFFSDIGLLLIDEVHLLNDPRGAALEAIVSRIKMLAHKPEMKSSPLSCVRFLAVSATIPNIEDLGISNTVLLLFVKELK